MKRDTGIHLGFGEKTWIAQRPCLCKVFYKRPWTLTTPSFPQFAGPEWEESLKQWMHAAMAELGFPQVFVLTIFFCWQRFCFGASHKNIWRRD
jgi:hypothetical protein